MASGSNKFSENLAKLPAFLRGLNGRQKWLLAGSAAATVAILGVFVALLGTPDYKPLYSHLSAEETQSVTAKLAANKIDYRISPDGGIQVRGDQLDAARLQVAADGPRGQRLGFEIFDKPNWLGNDFADNVNYQRALEGELERTIQSLSEVESARVHIVLPRESLFRDSEQPAKATVVLKLRQPLSEKAATAVTYLVAGAVNNLDPEHVTLINSDGNMPLPANRNGPGYGQQNSELESQLAQKLVATLEPVVGVGRVHASVMVDLERASTEDTRETYEPNSAVALTMQRSEERASDPVAGGVPGTASNVPNSRAAAPVPVPGEGNQYSKSENGTYAVNRSVRHVVQPPGAIKRISAAVLVDDMVVQKNGTAVRTKRSPEQMQQIEQLARAAIGLDSSRGDMLAVQNLAFDDSGYAVPPPVSSAERVWTLVSHHSDMLRYVALAVLFVAVYLLLLRPVKNQVITAIRALPAPAPAAAIAGTAAPGLLPQGTEPEQESAVLQRQLIEKVKREPANASRLVQSWLRENEGKK